MWLRWVSSIHVRDLYGRDAAVMLVMFCFGCRRDHSQSNPSSQAPSTHNNRLFSTVITFLFPEFLGFSPLLSFSGRNLYSRSTDRNENDGKKVCIPRKKEGAHVVTSVYGHHSVTEYLRILLGNFFCFFRLCMCIHMRIGPGTPSFSHLIRKKNHLDCSILVVVLEII